jgi:hypothetical protein
VEENCSIAYEPKFFHTSLCRDAFNGEYCLHQ